MMLNMAIQLKPNPIYLGSAENTTFIVFFVNCFEIEKIPRSLKFDGVNP